MLLHELEEKLIERGAKYIPYYDWSLDAQNPSLSTVLGPEIAGKASSYSKGSDMGVVEGPFQFLATETYSNLTRKVEPKTWDNPVTLNAILDKTPFSSFSYALEMVRLLSNN